MSPNRHPKATHMGNAVEIASPISSIHFCKLGPPLVLLLFDEKPQRSGGSRDSRGFLCMWKESSRFGELLNVRYDVKQYLDVTVCD